MQFLKWRKPKPSPICDAKTESYRSSYEAQRQKRLAPLRKAIQEGWHSDEREYHRTEKRYWRLTTILTFLAVAGAIATVLISSWTLEESRKATAEAHRQTEIAQSALLDGNRAWVSAVSAELIGPTDIDTIIDKYGILRTGFKITFENVGHSPAKVIHVLFAVMSSTQELSKRWDNMCDSDDNIARAAGNNVPNVVGFVIPPNGKFTAQYGYFAPIEGFAASPRNSGFFGKIYFLGCARYVDANLAPKHTRYCFEPATTPDGVPDFKNMIPCEAYQYME